jgi:hypothetical protein
MIVTRAIDTVSMMMMIIIMIIIIALVVGGVVESIPIITTLTILII